MKKQTKTVLQPSAVTKITDLENQIGELNDKLLRSLADYANLSKRIDDQRSLITTLTVAGIVNQLLPVLDDLYRTNDHLNNQGLKLTIDKFVSIFKTLGVVEINAADSEFDPELMECVTTADGKSNHVLHVQERGYKLNDQVVRPAKVVVGKQNDSSSRA